MMERLSELMRFQAKTIRENNCTTMSAEKSDEIADRLAYYEGLEERGLIALPCKPGDKVYRLVCWGKRNFDIRERTIYSVKYNSYGNWILRSTGNDVLGRTAFLTREEAEEALRRTDQ